MSNVILVEIDAGGDVIRVEDVEQGAAIDVRLETGGTISAEIRDEGPARYAVYDGEYVVIPRAADAIVLPTRSKVMRGDVTVTKVPYYETSNLSGGLTAYIASEV